jgi:hypothetical protein
LPIRNRFAAGAVFGEDLYEHFSGEVRYLYHDPIQARHAATR